MNDNLTLKEWRHLLRVALTGSEVGPDLFKMMEAMGREEVLLRLRHFMEVMESRSKDVKKAKEP